MDISIPSIQESKVGRSGDTRFLEDSNNVNEVHDEYVFAPKTKIVAGACYG
jgi:hypothetical protein